MLALHQALQPGGILIMTLRPPAYLHESDLMRPVLMPWARTGQTWLASPRYLFVPLPAVPENPQTHGDGQIDYGETVLTMPYLRERWSSRFDLLEVNVPLDYPYQVMVAMRRLDRAGPSRPSCAGPSRPSCADAPRPPRAGAARNLAATMRARRPACHGRAREAWPGLAG